MTTPEEPGFKVTVKDVYNEVRDIKTLLDGRLRKVEMQIAAQWVVISIVIVGLGAMVAQTLTHTS